MIWFWFNIDTSNFLNFSLTLFISDSVFKVLTNDVIKYFLNCLYHVDEAYVPASMRHGSLPSGCLVLEPYAANPV